LEYGCEYETSCAGAGVVVVAAILVACCEAPDGLVDGADERTEMGR
jgi:hypothetical protein